MTKSIKISEEAHRTLEYLKVMEDIKIGEYASEAILKNIKENHPSVYKMATEHKLI